MDQGSVGDCGLFRYRQFERVSEIPGIPATHTVPTLFPDQFVPGCELIPGPKVCNRHPGNAPYLPLEPGISSGVYYSIVKTASNRTTRSCPVDL